MPCSGIPSAKASTTICDATSPACAPPMPSATTNTGALAKLESSLLRRWRPTSVRTIVSAALSIWMVVSLLEVGELGVADADAVAVVQRLRPGQRLAVQVGAVGRSPRSSIMTLRPCRVILA